MCLLTFFPPGAKVDTDALEHGAAFNDDGHGFALIYPDADGIDRLAIGHGMNGAAVIARFERLRATYPNTPALFHSRIGTAGPNTTLNCHPFFLGDSADTVIAHNGILPQRVQPVRGKGDQRSDTGILAEDYLPGHPVFSRFDDVRSRRQFEKWLGTNKVVILTTDPQYLESYYLFGEDLGDWNRGVWYSNTSYKPYKSRSYAYGSRYDDYDASWTYDASVGVTTLGPKTSKTTTATSAFTGQGPVPSLRDPSRHWVRNASGGWELVPIPAEPVKSAAESAEVFESEDTYLLCEECDSYGIETGRLFCAHCLSCTTCHRSIDQSMEIDACKCRTPEDLAADCADVLNAWAEEIKAASELESAQSVVTQPVSLALPPGASATPSTVPTFSEAEANA